MMLSSRLLRSTIFMPYSVHVIPCTKLAFRRVSQMPCLSLGTIRLNSSLHPSKTCAKSSVSHLSVSSEQIKDDSPIKEAHLGIVFTCTAEGCSHRSSHTFTKRAYERGIVIVQCPGCKNRHLIADNLGWFKDSTEDGKLRNIEDLLNARGESVQRGSLDANGVVEYVDIEAGRK
ncbi:zf-DNL-domain-containing protein [Suillus subalutaceus]|uniref:zf-DNL-domain-containing protein n=1 Tax=Suillus subalutaceus TaxID=48586 RepID=UPI001B87603B|nr:zf-DNL-domain-containing protein [Suillus subalutaceus]KAG1860276.1 zf-DNL-domain-containing protein [Suillus subalutaceus]